MVLGATKVESDIGKQGTKIAEYWEAVNMAIAYASRDIFGGAHTPRSCMLTTVAGVLYNTPTESWDMNKELEDGRCEVDLNTYLVLMMTMNRYSDE